MFVMSKLYIKSINKPVQVSTAWPPVYIIFLNLHIYKKGIVLKNGIYIIHGYPQIIFHSFCKPNKITRSVIVYRITYDSYYFFSSPGPKVHVNYCHHLASVVCKFSHFKLLLRNHWADWNQT
jgi:hypothetical protein